MAESVVAGTASASRVEYWAAVLLLVVLAALEVVSEEEPRPGDREMVSDFEVDRVIRRLDYPDCVQTFLKDVPP